jgi:hypothetical protein
MNPHISKINLELAELRQALIKHPLYAQVSEIHDFQTFMEEHIFAVWDFMSLLKALQRGLTCIDLPWSPVGNPETRRLINEIVWGEESDVDANGNAASHFELYLDAMNEIGANTQPILKFIETCNYSNLETELQSAAIQSNTKEFVQFTFSSIRENELHKFGGVTEWAIRNFDINDPVRDLNYKNTLFLEQELKNGKEYTEDNLIDIYNKVCVHWDMYRPECIKYL